MSTVTRHRFSVEDYHRMVSAGIVKENDPVELIHGELLEKMPIGRNHAATVKRLNQLLVTRFAASATIGVQDPVQFDDSEPEPDVSVLRHRQDFYAAGLPLATDVLCLIEVSDTSLEYDRQTKLPLYAAGKIPEYWIVNLNEQTIEVYREGSMSGQYETRHDYRRGEMLAFAAFPDAPLAVDDILG